MAIYTVHAPPGAGVGERDEDIRFVKDGFSVAALLVPVIWLLWQRMWLVLLAWLAAAFLVSRLAYFAGDTAAVVVGLVFAVWFALEARTMLRWTLARRGYVMIGVVEGVDREAAERRFFETWLLGGTVAPAEPPPPTNRPAGAWTGGKPIIGLFPAKGH
jgi:hypothetical protein